MTARRRKSNRRQSADRSQRGQANRLGSCVVQQPHEVAEGIGAGGLPHRRDERQANGRRLVGRRHAGNRTRVRPRDCRVARRTASPRDSEPSCANSLATASASGGGTCVSRRPDQSLSIAAAKARASSTLGAASNSRGRVSLVGTLDQITPRESLQTVLPRDRGLPRFSSSEAFEHLLAVGNRLVFDRPPKQQRNVQIAGVFAPREQLIDNRQAVRGRQAFARASQLASHCQTGVSVASRTSRSRTAGSSGRRASPISRTFQTRTSVLG